MPGRSRRLDPLTGDYVRNAAGNGYVITTTAEPIIYHALKGRRGRWPGDARHGSDVYQFSEHGLDAEGLLFTANAARNALTELERDGLIKDFTVEVSADELGHECLVIRLTDITGGVLDVSTLTPFGGGDGSAL